MTTRAPEALAVSTSVAAREPQRLSMTLEHAAPRLDMSVRKLQRLCAAGKIDSFLDGCWYVTEKGIRDYIRGKGCAVVEDDVESPERDALRAKLLETAAELVKMAAELR